jgi:hypothetical protein
MYPDEPAKALWRELQCYGPLGRQGATNLPDKAFMNGRFSEVQPQLEQMLAAGWRAN